MSNYFAHIQEWFRTTPGKVTLLVAGFIAVIVLVVFNQQIGELLNLTGSRADTGRLTTINGNPTAPEINFIIPGEWDAQPNTSCFTTTNPETRLMLNAACPQAKIVSVAPNRGLAGDSVVINGSGFLANTIVKFNEVPATATEFTDETITVTVPAQVPGTGLVSVSVEAPGGTGNEIEGFTYASTPAITDLNPPIQFVGDNITITGLRFGTTQGTVSFGTTPAPGIVSWSDTSIVVTVPQGTGVVRVIVTNSDNIASPDGQFDEFTYAN